MSTCVEEKQQEEMLVLAAADMVEAALPSEAGTYALGVNPSQAHGSSGGLLSNRLKKNRHMQLLLKPKHVTILIRQTAFATRVLKNSAGASSRWSIATQL